MGILGRVFGGGVGYPGGRVYHGYLTLPNHISGWYVSYWNAFLSLQKVDCKKHYLKDYLKRFIVYNFYFAYFVGHLFLSFLSIT